MHVATFVNGDVFVVTKRVDGKLYHWKAYDGGGGDAATEWSLIKNKWTSNLHSTSDRGWFYFWADRLYYFDSIGGTKWDGTEASTTGTGVWKAGIETLVGPLLGAISGGGKEGNYHVAVTHINEKTGEESTATGQQSGGAVETRLSAATAKGGISITNWKDSSAGVADNTASADYEANAVGVYCTMGSTERIGLGSGVEQFSYKMFLEARALKSFTNPYKGLYRSDQIMATRPMLTNQGGIPPGAKFGCFNGDQAVYLEVYPRSNHSPTRILFSDGLAEGIMMFSERRFPAMVPQVQLYDIYITGLPIIDPNDRNNFIPVGGANEIPTGISGLITGCGHVGGSFLAFTNNSTYSMTPNGVGKMAPVLVDPIHGAIGYGPVVSTGRSVHAIGEDSWLLIGPEGVRNAAYEAFTPLIAAIPTAGIAATVGGHYSHENEVWFAVAKTGGTAGQAQRILIFGESAGGITGIFDPANLSTAGISAMVELSYPKQSPIMLVALDTGVILSWPGSQYTDAVTGGDNQSYACNWQGLFAQENRAYDMHLKRVDVHMEANVTDGITIGVAGHSCASRVDTDAEIDKLIPLTKANLTDRIGVDFDPMSDGNMYEVKISSTKAQGAHWKVGDMVMDIDRVS